MRQLAASGEFTSYVPNEFFIDQLKEITALRNSSAHTGNTSDNDDILQELLDRLRITHKWIEGIEQWRTATANTTRSYTEA